MAKSKVLGFLLHDRIEVLEELIEGRVVGLVFVGESDDLIEQSCRNGTVKSDALL
jgi:hypothetical protein